ncbi:hypothetical protein C8R44DRAFT_736776 [Mycena epipterygia]|nr:hypothetical protein C8R44DRAFT_736776 [Mycena epipterygia]
MADRISNNAALLNRRRRAMIACTNCRKRKIKLRRTTIHRQAHPQGFQEPTAPTHIQSCHKQDHSYRVGNPSPSLPAPFPARESPTHVGFLDPTLGALGVGGDLASSSYSMHEDTAEEQTKEAIPADSLDTIGDLPSSSSLLLHEDIGEEEGVAAPSNEQISTFVTYMPDQLPRSNDPTAVRPGDVDILQKHVPEGGSTFSIHRSVRAEDWVERHHDTTLLKSMRSVGLGGPIATMMYPDVPALAIFGSVLDDRVLQLAKALSDVSEFVVMIRPVEDDPLAKFTREIDAATNAEGGHSTVVSPANSEYGTDEETGNGDMDESDTEDSDDDFAVGEGGVFRLRGGASHQHGKCNIVEGPDPDYIVPSGIDRPDGFHRTRVKLHLQLHETCVYDVAIASKTSFKFQTEKSETPHALTEPISRPQVLSCVDLKVETKPFEVLLDRSYSNLGFIVHRPKSIAGREYLPRGFEPPAATATRSTRKSTQSSGSLAVGLDTMQPTLMATASRSRTTGESPLPSCHVQEQIGKEWDSGDMSYSSYDVAWHPMVQTNGSAHPVNIRFGMGIDFFGKEERYIYNLPTISHILRNQVILWVFDPELKAKVRGMVVLTSTYIPDIKIPEPLSILEDQVVDLAVNRSNLNLKNPPATDMAPSAHDAANSVAIGLFDERKDAVKSSMRKFMHRITPKSSRRATKQSALADLPLHEYVARGWDATNEQWRNTVWPKLDEGFVDARGSSSAAWNLALDPGTKNLGTDSGDLDNPSASIAGQLPPPAEGMVMDPPTENSTQPLSQYSDTDSSSSASGSNPERVSVMLVKDDGSVTDPDRGSTDSGGEGFPVKQAPVSLMEVDP